MVPAEMTKQLRSCLATMKEITIRAADYEGLLFDIAFDVITSDTYVAGIATKLLDGDRVEPAEVEAIGRPMLQGNMWSYEGQAFDLSPHPEILRAAQAVEHTRKVCVDICKK